MNHRCMPLNAASMPKIHIMIFVLHPGKITVLHQPGGHGVRVDSHVYAGYVIPPYYDSMIGKLITVARTREEAINTMYRALSEYVIEGVKTTIPFHLQLMQNERFRSGDFNTKFLEGFTSTIKIKRKPRQLAGFILTLYQIIFMY